MFDIAFSTDEPELQDEGWYGLWGRTTLGSHSERFLAPLGHWHRADYERQWIEAAQRLLETSDRTGFFTDAFRFWWTMWREGERVYVHEELLGERLAGITDLSAVPYHLIEDRVTHTEVGEQVSEWELALSDLRAFVERRAAQ